MKAGSSNSAGILTALLVFASGARALEVTGNTTGLRMPTAETLQLSAPATLSLRARGEWIWTRVTSFSSAPAWRWRLSPADLSLGADLPSQGAFSLRNNTHLSWQPFALGAWRLGASLGLSDRNDLAGGATWTTYPVAAYESDLYRLNLGLVPPRGTRDTMLLMGVTVPLR